MTSPTPVTVTFSAFTVIDPGVVVCWLMITWPALAGNATV